MGGGGGGRERKSLRAAEQEPPGADRGSKSKKGVVNTDAGIDMVSLAHKGAAFIDCISPCVPFNNHVGSTKSFDYVREPNEAVNTLDVIMPRDPIHVSYNTANRAQALGYLQARARRVITVRRSSVPAARPLPPLHGGDPEHIRNMCRRVNICGRRGVASRSAATAPTRTASSPPPPCGWRAPCGGSRRIRRQGRCRRPRRRQPGRSRFRP